MLWPSMLDYAQAQCLIVWKARATLLPDVLGVHESILLDGMRLDIECEMDGR